ncbi:AAA family ATPase [Pseudomonas sp. TH49]|uniref:AAA family ATPase n=1 Tax=Pseudomonas sp. TH49 TaxID=2796413 RepID=UPI0019146BE1|nr:AAA family ATPase [Pseudomonas sp. TH49]MBK5344332.1 AAA family ATPase [Pseudomonas sp. TH49]
MRLGNIRLKNYRGFERFNLKLHPDVTVIVGVNGCGKTTLMSALRLLLWSYVRNYVDDIRPGSPPRIDIDDVHRIPTASGGIALQFPCSVEGKFVFPDDWDSDAFDEDDEDDLFESLHLNKTGCALKTEKGRLQWSRGSFVDVRAAEKAMDAVSEDLDLLLGADVRPTDLPVIACYGTSRLWKRSAGLRGTGRSTIRFAGYDGATSVKSSFMRLEWFVMFLFSSASSGLLNRNSIALLWKGVGDAICTVTGWQVQLPRSGEKDLLFEHGSEKLKLSQLGDGVRCMIELVGDLACRCALLNYHYKKDAVKKTSGVVLIDEIDMHLHPGWQQTILKQLQDAFPKVQFIVTTHSPQVLSTVRRENIRVVDRNANGQIVASEPLVHTYGESSGDVLQSVMEVDPLPPVPEKTDLKRLTALVDQGFHEAPESVLLMEQLIATLGELHPQLLRLKRDIQRQKALNK